MKTLHIQAISEPSKVQTFAALTHTLDALPRHPLREMLWFSDGIKPVVAFAMGYAHNCIYLKFYVQEPQIQAKYRQTNGPVYKDSCVELFIAFNNEATYYNLEFNCLGTGLVGFGENRHKRRLLPGSTVERIKTWASLTVDGQATWELTLAIPAAIFSAHHLSTFEGLRARANFYKGGEELPIPHYLAWNAIQAQQPDFHRPEFFGELQFA